MASIVLTGDTSGSFTVSAPAVAGSNTQTLVATTGTLAPIVSGTAVASTSGTSIDFTGIPSWAKRITVMFRDVSTNGTSNLQIQIGSTSFTTSGYSSVAQFSSTATAFTTGFGIVNSVSASSSIQGVASIVLLGSNIYAQQGNLAGTGGSTIVSAGSVALSATLDRVRITTVNGTDTFDAGSINILYE